VRGEESGALRLRGEESGALRGEESVDDGKERVVEGRVYVRRRWRWGDQRQNWPPRL
jgi:hypothetical protein